MDPPFGSLLDAEGSRAWRDLRSTPLSDDLIPGADLVLTATLSHSFRTSERWPSAYQRTFTLGEAARLVPAAIVRQGLRVAERERALTAWLLGDERSVRQVLARVEHGSYPSDRCWHADFARDRKTAG